MSHTTEHTVSEIIKDTLNNLGFDLVKVTFKGLNSKVLEILIDRANSEKITIADCRAVSRSISALLDVEDVIKDKYYLEVSSAGVERPLVKFDDYVRFLGRDVKVKLKELLNGAGHYRGRIVSAVDDNIELEVNGKIMSIKFELIKGAHLVLTDEMFRNLLNSK